MADQPADQQTATPPQEATAPSNFEDLLSSIKNEQGQQKYADVPTALDGLKNAQDYIPQLKQQLTERDEELNRLKAELKARSSVEEQVSKLMNQQPAQPQEPPAAVPTQPEAPAVNGLSEEQAKALFEQMLQNKAQVDSATSNRQLVNESLVKQYGNQAATVVQGKLSSLGVTTEQFEKLSAESPQLVLNLFQTEPAKSPATATSSINTSAMMPPEQKLERPKKSLMRGATTQDNIEYLHKIRQYVNNRYQVTQN